jgi:hypothetical protein
MDWKNGIKEINAIIADRNKPPGNIRTSQQELARLIKKLEKARKLYREDLDEFLTFNEYFNFKLWEKKNQSRDAWLDVADEITNLSSL